MTATPDQFAESNTNGTSTKTDQPAFPWQGEPTQLHPPTEVRETMRTCISAGLLRHMGNLGIAASDLADEVARLSYEETGEVVFNDSDVTLEISRMLGTSIRMAPNNRLYPS